MNNLCALSLKDHSAVRDYVRGYWGTQEDVVHFEVKASKISREGPDCVDVPVCVTWKDGSREDISMTCWMEEGSPYGEW